MASDSVEEAMRVGVEHHRANRLAEAEGIYREVLKREPNLWQALYLLGVVAQQVGKHDGAIPLLRRAAELKSDSGEIYGALGVSLGVLGRLEDAQAALEKAIVLLPGMAEAHLNLGNVFEAQGMYLRAVECYGESIGRGTDTLEARFNRGKTLARLGRYAQAIDDLRRVVSMAPGFAQGHLELGAALSASEDPADVAVHVREAVRLEPTLAAAQERLLHLGHYLSDVDPKENFERHREWARRFAETASREVREHRNSKEPGRRLRVGYVSPDFRRHSVSYFVEPLLAGHDKGRVEVFCYADEIKRDQTTERLKGYADCWRNITGVSHEQAAEMVREDRIDILVDLAGHVGTGRLMVFARKPAPVQVSYLGYPDTTGLAAMDYRITDGVADPAGSEGFYTEKLVRIAGCGWCYTAPMEQAGGSSLREEGVTFGSFNVALKINRSVIEVWAEILRAVPDSRMIIKDGQGSPSPAHGRIRTEFERCGIEAERVELLSFVEDVGQHLGLYQRVDVALDPFPYNGTTTTCEAMWMGTPVVTMSGSKHVSRVGASLLGAVGLGEMVARSAEEYVEVAARLAGDVERRRELRRKLRERMRESVLMDGKGFARKVEEAYRGMWERWCAKGVNGRE